MTRVLVLGAQGLLGHHTAIALREAGYDVVRGGRRPETATDFRLIDFDSAASMRRALVGVAIVVSSIEDPDTRFEREVLDNGGLFLSQATIPAPARRSLSVRATRDAGGSVILNAGLSGVGGLVARDLLERHPDADLLELGYIISTGGSGGLAGVSYVHRLLTGQASLNAVTRRFPAPFGLLACFDLSGNDEIWLSPQMLAGRVVRPCLSVAEPWLRNFLLFSNRWGFLARLPKAMFTAGVRLKRMTKTLTREPMRVRVAAYRGAELLEASGIDADGDYHSTVQSTVVFVSELLKRAPGALPRGVCNVEDVLRLGDVSNELAKDGFVVRPLNAS